MTEERHPDARSTLNMAGRLLIATPLLLDPNFFRTVVYIAEHGDDGAVGLVLNRPTTEPVADHLPGWEPLVSDPAVVFVGGPVANEVAVGVVERPEIPPLDWEPGPGDVGLLDLSNEPDTVGGVAEARVFSGYSGWVGGQLELELGSGSWIVAEATPGDVFTSEPESLWRRVLRRQPDGRSLYASFPDDLRSN